MSVRNHKTSAAFALALLTSACTTMPDGRIVSLPDAPKQTQAQPAAQREHQRILANYGGAYDDPKLEAAIGRIVDKLVAASERPDLKYRVTILNSPSINAFALPGGELYVTRGLIALANDSSEIASVLSHEMAHVIARHAAIREDQVRQAAIVGAVVSDVLSDPAAGALALAKSKLALASFSRAQEFEADGIGVGIAARAGYDPFGATRLLTQMERNASLRPISGEARSPEFLASHPATPERVQNALANARQFSAPGGGVRDKPGYLATLDGVIYGEDPSEGFVRGRRFLHPKLGFTFTAPDGFALDNTAQAVLGIKEGGNQALRLDVVQVPAEQSLSAYLASGWMEKVDPKNIEEFTVNGFPAAGATAVGDEWAFRLYAVRFGSEVYRFIFAAKLSPENRPAEYDRAFRASLNTFRRMTIKESEDALPLRLKVVTVRHGDTAERLARQMAIPQHAVERFRVLNGLAPGEQPKPGDQVKLVVE